MGPEDLDGRVCVSTAKLRFREDLGRTLLVRRIGRALEETFPDSDRLLQQVCASFDGRIGRAVHAVRDGGPVGPVLLLLQEACPELERTPAVLLLVDGGDDRVCGLDAVLPFLEFGEGRAPRFLSALGPAELVVDAGEVAGRVQDLPRLVRDLQELAPGDRSIVEETALRQRPRLRGPEALGLRIHFRGLTVSRRGFLGPLTRHE